MSVAVFQSPDGEDVALAYDDGDDGIFLVGRLSTELIPIDQVPHDWQLCVPGGGADE